MPVDSVIDMPVHSSRPRVDPLPKSTPRPPSPTAKPHQRSRRGAVVALNGMPSPELVQQLHNLRVFLFAANAGSMARAAEQLYRAPSAVTRSITELERVVGVRLFERRPRAITLTDAGAVVQAHAARIQEEIMVASRPFLSATGGSASLHTIATLLCNGRKLLLITYLASLRNISSAAARMDMTQAGASMALARMEEVLGEPLFHRRSDGMVATEAAERLVGQARRIFTELRFMVSELSTSAGEIRGNVVIGTTPLGRTDHITRAIAGVIADNPGLRITTLESSYAHLADMVARGEVDLLIGALRPSHQSHGLLTESLFVDRLAVIARAGHPLASHEKVTLADMAQERWVLPRPHALSRPLIDAAFADAGVEPPLAAIETGDLAILRQLVLTTDMLAIAAPHHLSRDIEEGLLMELDVGALSLTRNVGLIRQRGHALSSACQIVIDAIREELMPQVASPMEGAAQ